MVNFLMFAGVVSCGIFMYMIYNWIVIPRSSRDVKRTAANLQELKKSNNFQVKKRQALVKALADLFRDLRIFPYTKRYVQTVNRVLAGLDEKVDGKPMTVDYVYVKQCLYSLIPIGAAIFGFMFLTVATGKPQPIAFVAIVFMPIAYKIPLNNLEEKLHMEQMEAMSQFHEFYDLYYCQFIREENNLLLMDVVSNFIPMANKALRRMLERFLIDLETGEEVALNKFNDRYPDNQRVHKFVSIALMRMQGDVAAYDVMKSFRAEQYQEIKMARVADLNKRVKRGSDVVTTVMMVLIACFMIVMCAAVLTS